MLENTTKTWTDERVELLRQFNDKGSNADIAKWINEQAGTSFTRNAIIGKRMRLGLIQVREPKSRAESRQGKYSKRVLRSDFKRGHPRPADFGTLFDIANMPLPPEFLGIPLEKLTDKTCKYPRGDSPFVFCGQPSKEDSSYCPHCHSLCYQRPEPPSDKRHRQKYYASLAGRAT